MFGGLGVDADADGGGGRSSSGMLPSPQPLKVGTPPLPLPLGSIPASPGVSYVAPSSSPYPTIVDPFKRRTALQHYFRGFRGGEDKENDRGGGEGDAKSPASSLPKQKTLGLCRRHVVSPSPSPSPSPASASFIAVSGDGLFRDKRKFNAPRQTPEKRQRPVESDLGPLIPRRLDDVVNRLSVEDGSSDDEFSQSLLEFASRELVELEARVSPSISRQSQQSQSVSFKQQAPRIRKPLAPVNINRQASSQVQVQNSPMACKPNFSGGVEREGHSASESLSLFQLASGKRYQPSAAAKARAASLFGSDADF